MVRPGLPELSPSVDRGHHLSIEGFAYIPLYHRECPPEGTRPLALRACQEAYQEAGYFRLSTTNVLRLDMAIEDTNANARKPRNQSL